MKISILKYGTLDSKGLKKPTHPDLYFLKRLSKGNRLQIINFSEKNAVLRCKNIEIINTKLAQNKVFSQLHQILLFSRLAKFRPETILAFGDGSSFILPWIFSIIFRKKVIYLVAGEINQRHLRKSPFYRVFIKAISIILKSKGAVAILAISNPVKQQIIGMGVDISKVYKYDYEYPNYFLDMFNKPLIKRKRDTKQLRLLFIGRLTKEKGVFDIIEIAKGLRGQNFKFTLIGDGEAEGDIQRLIKTNMLTREVVLIGKIKHSRIPAYLLESDLLLFPTHHEGLGLVVLEAILAGRPVIASRTGGIVDLIRDNREGLLLNPGDIEGFRNAIIRLSDKRVYSKMQRNILKRRDKITNPSLPLFRLVKGIIENL